MYVYSLNSFLKWNNNNFLWKLTNFYEKGTWLNKTNVISYKQNSVSEVGGGKWVL